MNNHSISSKMSDLECYATNLRRSYPHKTGDKICTRSGCKAPAPSGEECAEHILEDITKLIGSKTLADLHHQTVKAEALAYDAIRTALIHTHNKAEPT